MALSSSDSIVILRFTSSSCAVRLSMMICLWEVPHMAVGLPARHKPLGGQEHMTSAGLGRASWLADHHSAYVSKILQCLVQVIRIWHRGPGRTTIYDCLVSALGFVSSVLVKRLKCHFLLLCFQAHSHPTVLSFLCIFLCFFVYTCLRLFCVFSEAFSASSFHHYIQFSLHIVPIYKIVTWIEILFCSSSLRMFTLRYYCEFVGVTAGVKVTNALR